MATAPTSPLMDAGPHIFQSEVRIARPVAEVYPLLDLADPRHAKRQLGERVDSVAGEADTYSMVIATLPDAVFTLKVTHAVPLQEYGYSCTSSLRFGRMIHSHEHYALHATRSKGCRIVLTQTATFDGPISEEDYGIEAMMLSFAGSSALGKIKLHAEDGVEAVRALTNAQHAALDALGGPCG